jgi:hypothetical protein
MSTTYGIAKSESPEHIAAAVQQAFIKAMQKIVADMKADFKTPGLTWEQLDYLFEEFLKKKPTIVKQEFEF